MKNIVCFGEVLWDVFPTHKKIGGAPLNVAVRLQSFDNNVSIITRIGEDSDGEGLFKFIKENGVAVDNIQMDSELKTGEVAVSLNEEGSASYTINYPRAWDHIQLTKSAKDVTLASDAFIFGSLSARDFNSKQTLYDLLEIAPYKIFDVNLRAPYYTKDILNHLMESADFIKFNDAEIIDIVRAMNFETQSIEEGIAFIAKQTKTKSICVTLGSKGAILFYKDTFYYNKGYKINVVDTVGAGDSFLAALTDRLLKGDSPQTAIDFACAVGAVVASSEGANPKLNQNDIDTLMSKHINC
ncbi:carbohydrate kinase family protein [Winogradskyella sp. PC D3.3]